MTEHDKWYLSFDCATKSFAFALVRVRPPGEEMLGLAKEASAALDARDAPRAKAALDSLAAKASECLHLAGGGAADFFPGVPDKEISTVERIDALVAYLRGPVAKALADAPGCPKKDSKALNVMVEYQMGANSPARAIAVGLLTYYVDANAFEVGASFKNKLWFPARPDLRHCYFIEKYSKLYDANKAHVKELYFEHLGPLFEHRDLGIPKVLAKDFADAAVQVIGFIAYGDPARARSMF